MTEPIMYTTGKPRRRAARFAEREKQMHQLYDAGLNDREISAKLGCSESEVGRLRRKLGLPTQLQREREAKRAAAEEKKPLPVLQHRERQGLGPKTYHIPIIGI